MTMIRTAKYMVGFTLIEVVIVIVLTGILGVVATSFFTPLQGYFGALDRAELSDVADTALRRMGRELHAALPNSVRVSGNYIEFLPTITGGRYRANSAGGTAGCGSAGDDLSFSGNDTCFEVIGTLSTAPSVGQELVVYNTSNTSALGVYANDNVAALTSDLACTLSATKICFSGGMQFPLESPSKRFQIISGPVTFACVGNTLWRYSGYARQASQPTNVTSAPLSTATSIARLATGVKCDTSNFSNMSGTTQRAGLVTMSLTLSNSPEPLDSITLLHQVHVQNVP
jgi:MSHA biogenesis protein MshO